MADALSQDVPFELQTLANACRYQQWMLRAIKPYLGQRILELGAGIGNLSQWLHFAEQLIVTESDPQLFILLQKRYQSFFKEQEKKEHIEILNLDIVHHSFANLYDKNLDTIISFNVLEHIEDDRFVLEKCVDLLNQQKMSGKKRIITWVPAHPVIYGELDRELGHYRRYTKTYFKQLHANVLPSGSLVLKSFNFAGFFGWLVNSRLLKKKAAGKNVINAVEKLCPLFQIMDHIFIQFFQIPLGQSLIAIQEWET